MKVLVLLSLIVLPSCYHTISIPPDRLEDVVASFHSDKKVFIESDEGEIEVTADMAPLLMIETNRECSIWHGKLDYDCDESLRLRFEDVRLEKGKMKMLVSKGFFVSRGKEVELGVGEIEEVDLRLDFTPPSFDPTFAFGMAIGGPVGLIGFQMHWMPLEALVFDPAFFGAPHLFVAGGGFRIRPIRLGFVLPFVGAGVQFLSFAGTAPDNTASRFLAGPRVGVDFEFFNRRVLFGVEADLFYDITNEGTFAYQNDSRWKPYGGLHIAYQL